MNAGELGLKRDWNKHLWAEILQIGSTAGALGPGVACRCSMKVLKEDRFLCCVLWMGVSVQWVSERNLGVRSMPGLGCDDICS